MGALHKTQLLALFHIGDLIMSGWEPTHIPSLLLSSKPHPVTPPRSQQHHHNRQSRLSHNRPKPTSSTARPSHQTCAAAIAQPPLSEDLNKLSTPERPTTNSHPLPVTSTVTPEKPPRGRQAYCLAAVAHRTSCIVWYHRARVIVTHVEHSRACNLNSNNAFLPLTMPTLLNFFFPQGTPRIIRFGHGFMAHVVATRAYIWARPILVGVGAELLERGQAFAVGSISSASSKIDHFTDEACEAVIHADLPRLR
ncbi:hypothetical protein F5888DRAFT_1804224 [Russula emetica]|nr:hypothetical protein F5888DRAFT_1804224 [Russula emetica]